MSRHHGQAGHESVVADQTRSAIPQVALVGNPNAGKTTLFNRLTGLRAKTSNFSGTTIERHAGRLELGNRSIELLDLPGLYGLEAATAEEIIARAVIVGEDRTADRASLALVVIDATNLARNLFLVGEIRDLGRPTVVSLNMMDLARKNGVEIDAEALERELMVPVVPISARTGEGVDRLLEVIDRALTARDLPLATTSNETAGCGACHGCSHSQRYDWAEQIAARTTRRNLHLSVKRTEQIDRWLTHPVLGLLFFAVLMAAFFMSLFWLADWPMSLIEAGVAALGGWIRTCLPQGVFQSFVVDGVIGGVGGVIVFLPQICLLFFLLSLLEETGYLARAAFVMDRLMRRVGLPGKAFVPMLSAHACAIPAIMSTRVIDDRRDRLVTILILPLLTCSARLPVYALITAMLFAGQPLKGGLVFFGAYSLGILAALTMAWVFKRTILKGNSRPLLIELPTYKVPSLRNALLGSVDQGLQFLKKAGTVILLISIVLWAMATWPAMSKEDALARLDAAHRARFTRLEKELAAPEGLEEETRLEREAELERIVASRQLEHSLAGRLGKLIVPVFRPLGFDWRINVGVLSSFAARETFASTMGVIFSKGNHDKDPRALGAMLRGETRADGTRLFQTANCSSLLVFYIFAMQCLPTQAITRKETGSWKWAMFQLVYMTLLAYSAAFLTYRLLLWL